MTKDIIYFKYYNPTLYYIVNAISLILLFSSIYIFLNNYEFPKALELICTAFVIFIFVLYLAQKRIEDLNGSFRFDKNGFKISTPFIRKYIPYSDIWSIKKEFYKQQVDLIVASATQSNTGQYKISLFDKSAYKFRIARSEEKEYQKAIRKLMKKIYNINRLGVHLTSSFNNDKRTTKQKDEQFEKEKPVLNYSLEKAINELLDKSELELIDLTV